MSPTPLNRQTIHHGWNCCLDGKRQTNPKFVVRRCGFADLLGRLQKLASGVVLEPAAAEGQ